MSGRKSNILLLCIACLFWSSLGHSEEFNKLDKLKAAYLFNFSKYITWPAEAFNAPDAPINLCLQANDAFIAFTRELTKNRTVGLGKRPVKVLEGNNQSHCHIRYLTSDIHSLQPFTPNTLIVSSKRGLNVPQTSIWFFREGPKLRFEIDLNKARQLNLSISSELLKLARIK